MKWVRKKQPKQEIKVQENNFCLPYFITGIIKTLNHQWKKLWMTVDKQIP